MPRIFVPPQQLVGDRVTLDRASAKHLVKVLRLAVGAEVRVFDGCGAEIEARIVRASTAGVELALGERHRVPLPATTITLLQSVPRGDRMDFIVQKTTELGVTRIVPVLTSRGMVKPPAGKSHRWQTIAQEAARQSGRVDVPEIGETVALDEALTGAAAAGGTRLIFWEEERALPLRKALAETPSTQLALLIGPEGGFAEAEVAAARAQGFCVVGLGPRILRVETAALVAVALTQSAIGGLD
ncbi:MAG TPA: 16S rRNA (uracil(1498)-N(3))-methyltransferase [Polyangia bacterium]